MTIERLPISRNALKIIISDARDLRETLEAAGLERAAEMMASVVEQLVSDSTGISGPSGFMLKTIDPSAS